jgi:hypothetical protein
LDRSGLGAHPDERFVTGEAKDVDDTKLPGTLH